MKTLTELTQKNIKLFNMFDFELQMIYAWLQARESEYHNTAEGFKLIDESEYWKNKGKESAMLETQKYIKGLFEK